MTELSTVIIDWGGVLTQPIGDTVRDWIAADQIDWDSYMAVIGPWLSDAYDTAAAPDGTALPASARGLAADRSRVPSGADAVS